jgi:prepilin-type N-terminal cleavage/methylation domain-containing protein
VKRARGCAGFTLAEVAVTLVIVGIGLVLVLQGLNASKISAAETHNRKVARELALQTLGQLESGLFWEELDGTGDSLTGTYAEEGWEDFHYEVVLGEDEFLDSYSGRDQDGYWDTWKEARARAAEEDEDDEKDEEVVEPYEKVRIKVVYPQFGDRPHELVLERWIPWDQVYGAQTESGTKADAP